MSAAITINFRKPKLTVECVESLLVDGWFPVLVWDNSDDGGESMRSMEVGLDGRSGVHLVSSPTNLGFAAGMNHALAHLGRLGDSGPVLLVNNDARVKVGLRMAMEARLGVSPSPVLIAPRIDQSGREQGWIHYQPWLGLVSSHPIWGGVRYLSGCCLLVNRVHNGLPLFDEAFFMYGEDVELSRRIDVQGGELAILDDVYVFHLGSVSSGYATSFYERQIVRAHWLLAGKLGSNPASRAVMRALRLPVLFLRAGVRSLRFRSWEPLKALAELFR